MRGIMKFVGKIKMETALRISAGVSLISVIGIALVTLVPWSAVAQLAEAGQMIGGLAETIETAGQGSLVRMLIIALILSQIAIIVLLWMAGRYLLAMVKRPDLFSDENYTKVLKNTLYTIWNDFKKEEMRR